MTTAALLGEAVRELAAHGVRSPRADAELLLALALGDAHTMQPNARELAVFRRLVERRAACEPLAYIVGEVGFRKLRLAVDRRAFIPRLGTEVVVERSLVLLRGLDEPWVLDLGTGSGAIALAIADEHPTARVTAVERSADALTLARENAVRTGLAERVELVEGDLFAGLEGPFDLVVSNPPYLSPAAFGGLEPETRLHEPFGALVGAGLSSAIARDASEILVPGGWLVLECGADQGETLAGELRSLGYERVFATPDERGRDRVVEGRRPECQALAA
jgi:release factor glutamine methyltransferase